jgi:hypothetical protein
MRQLLTKENMMRLRDYIEKEIEKLEYMQSEYLEANKNHPDIWNLDEDEDYWVEVRRIIMKTGECYKRGATL